jgi:hypothetical protein
LCSGTARKGRPGIEAIEVYKYPVNEPPGISDYVGKLLRGVAQDAM